jgi:hypothetical protein
VTLSAHTGEVSLPPPGVFGWHYLHCVIRAFGTPEYKNFPNIAYPFKTEDRDGEHEYMAIDEAGSPFPSSHLEGFESKLKGRSS